MYWVPMELMIPTYVCMFKGENYISERKNCYKFQLGFDSDGFQTNIIPYNHFCEEKLV